MFDALVWEVGSALLPGCSSKFFPSIPLFSHPANGAEPPLPRCTPRLAALWCWYFHHQRRSGAAVRTQHPTGLSAVQTQHDKFTSSAGISDLQVTPTVILTSATCRLSAVKLPLLRWKNRVFVCCVFVLVSQSQRAKETPGCSHLSV